MRKRFTERRPRRVVRFQLPPGEKIDYKNINLLQRFISERGKIQPRRVSGVTAKEQRDIARAIKKARYLGLMVPRARPSRRT